MYRYIALFVAVFFLSVAPAGFARTANIEGAEVTLIGVGDNAPEFSLFGVDLQYHSLSDYRDKNAIVVVFHCNHCPVSKGNTDRLIQLGEAYQERNVQFLAVNPNPADKVPADGFMEMKERAQALGYPFPYLYDETQQTAAAYGARFTDHVFILGGTGPEGRRQVKFIGPVDNRGDEPVFLARKLDKILEGEEIEEPEVSAFGCTVKYRNEGERISRFGSDIFAD